jgi:hypothetical protein
MLWMSLAVRYLHASTSHIRCVSIAYSSTRTQPSCSGVPRHASDMFLSPHWNQLGNRKPNWRRLCNNKHRIKLGSPRNIHFRRVVSTYVFPLIGQRTFNSLNVRFSGLFNNLTPLAPDKHETYGTGPFGNLVYVVSPTFDPDFRWEWLTDWQQDHDASVKIKSYTD